MNENKSSYDRYKVKGLLFLIVVFSLLLVTCTEEDNNFLIGEDYIESQTDITLVDTFSVDVSTVLMDTVNTSGTGRILLGNYSDDEFGEIHSNSYFEIGVPDTFYVTTEDVYDSLTFVLTYNNYYFGDTTLSQKISVHQLTENIEFNDDDYLGANETFNYDPEELGSTVYTPKPLNTRNDSVIIRLNDDLGQELFDMFYNVSDYVGYNEIFIRYFKGIALVADEAYEGNIIGFNGGEGQAAMILHTTRHGQTDTKIEYVFELVNDSKQFNSVIHDFQSTPLQGLSEQETALPSSEADGQAYIQGGTGLTVRVDFPTLQRILLEERGTVMEAELVLAPVYRSSSNFELPSDLNVYEVNNVNELTASGISSSVLTVDELYNEDTYYTFDITSYIKAELADNYVEPGYGLLITIPGSEFTASFERVMIDAQNKNTQLKIYYMTY